MPNLVLSTCGTSLLTNLAGEQRGLVIRHANATTPKEVPEPDRRILAGLIATAAAIARVIAAAGGLVEVKRIPDLRTDDQAAFRAAMAELVRLCAHEVRDFRAAGWRVVFNLTGGFRSVQGFMQVLARISGSRAKLEGIKKANAERCEIGNVASNDREAVQVGDGRDDGVFVEGVGRSMHELCPATECRTIHGQQVVGIGHEI